jgi:hypothetical protein
VRKTNFDYKTVLADKSVEDFYTSIDKVPDKDHTYHGLQHIKNTIEVAIDLFKVVGIEKDKQDAILIALALHDFGKGYESVDENGVVRKIKDHGIAGAIKAEKYLENKNVKYRDEIINAIKEHSDAGMRDEIIGATVCLCDHLDVTKKRMWDKPKFDKMQNKNIEPCLYRTNKINFAIDNKTFVVEILVDDDYPFECFVSSLYYARQMIAIATFAKILGYKYLRKITYENKKQEDNQ